MLACTPTGTRRRPARLLQILRWPRNRRCCWYHEGDWSAASAIAIGIRSTADDAGGDDETRDERVRDELRRAQSDGLTGWTLAAVCSLLLDPIQPGNADEGGEPSYVNGRHRTQAMLDLGVDRTLVAYWDWPNESHRQS